MNIAPAVSVLMSVHNGERFLKKSIDSILNQTFKDFEFIIVNDGSTDTTPEILKLYADSDDRIKIITNPVSLYLPGALNLGLAAAHGKYIARQDDDDIAMPHRLRLEFEYLEAHPEVFLCGGSAIIIDENDNSQGFFLMPTNEKVLSDQLTSGNNRLIHPSIMFRNAGSWRYRENFINAQDLDLYLLMLSAKKKLVNLPHVLMFYRKNNFQSGLIDKSVRQYRCRQLARKFYFERLGGGKDSYDETDFTVVNNFDQEQLEGIGVDELSFIARTGFALGKQKLASDCVKQLNKVDGKRCMSFWRRALLKFPPELFTFLHKCLGRCHTSTVRLPRLALLASTGNGLETWNKIGSTHRELAIYRQLMERGWLVDFYTYDKGKATVVDGINVLPVSRFIKLPSRLCFLWGWWLPLRYWFRGRNSTAVITNQAHSGWPAIIMGRLWRCPVIARCGDVGLRAAEALHRPAGELKKIASRERFTFLHASFCLIPAEELVEWCAQRFGLDRKKVMLAPNYVNLEHFHPVQLEKKYDLIAVGRIGYQKNYDLLLDAVKGSCWKILIIGGGDAEGLLEKAREVGVNLDVISRVSNEDLPKYLNLARIYVMCSRWEGHPKALVEAMACGCAAVVCDAPGVTRQVEHGRTALVTEYTAQALRDGIQLLLDNPQRCADLGRNAAQYAAENFSLNKVVDIYESAILSCIAKCK